MGESIYEALGKIQAELKAPKSNYNSFGKYKYRSAEDILEAVKPLCAEHGAVLTLSDSVEAIGGRVYIKATATLTLTEDPGCKVYTAAYAREPEEKKSMDASQVTGAASSYARKYALNGLFDIDDTKDADTDAYHNITASTADSKASIVSERQKVMLENLIKKTSTDKRKLLDYYGVKSIKDMSVEQYTRARAQLKKKMERADGR